MLLLLLQCEKISRHPFNNLRYLNRYVSQMTTILFSFLAKITVNDWHNTHLAFFPPFKAIKPGEDEVFDEYCRSSLSVVHVLRLLLSEKVN